ncbi:MAG TPA: carbamoyl-phosphate synthase (glutamine-hydrolyzing) large subunit [Candidatus Paceibacterota bacterium]
MKPRQAKLILKDGTTLEGVSFGAVKSVSGEVVFATGMVGYPEAFTDPSFRGQILVLTYPLVGNYGVPMPEFLESKQIQITGLIVSSYIDTPSHHASVQTLGDWLKKEGIPALEIKDTRMLTQKLRSEGVSLGKIIADNKNITFEDPNLRNLVAEVSTKEIMFFGNGEKTLIVIDCGAKQNIVRRLTLRGFKVAVVPWDTNVTKLDFAFSAVVISNGPGNPEKVKATIENVKKIIHKNIPVLGICLGNQILTLALGGTTYKMKFGHRSQNQPVVETVTQKCYLTTQNHGFAVKRIPPGFTEWFRNANDNTNEGIIHKTLPIMSVQFHPESSPGPLDTDWIFDYFLVKAGVHALRRLPSILEKQARSGRSEYSSEHARQLLDLKMNKNNQRKLKKILVLGSGALKIGEAGEFDYSGSQAIKALKEEKIKVILVNPNIATFQTSKTLADEVYFLPVNEYFVEKVIKKERPDGVMLSFGGQTALNCGLSLFEKGVFKKYNVEILGSPISSIELTEDREKFAEHLRSIDVPVPDSGSATNLKEAKKISERIGFPLMVRAAFALGGQKSGVARNEQELQEIVTGALAVSPQVLIEKYLHHFKEIEYEVVRDAFGNTVTVCNMENLDPLGIHTGDSIVVAPSQTLNNEEYHGLREASIKIVESLKIVGECNVQYALNPSPKNGKLDYFVIEVNARLSRSSALASKATGYPLAYVAAKLALGRSLLSIENKITKVTQSFFEPALDYVVVKMPRWDLAKFSGAIEHIGSAMKSVGEVMAIGRSFEEALQKAVRMTSGSVESLTDNGFKDKREINNFLSVPTPKRIFAVAESIKKGISIEKIRKITGIDLWFLHRIENIVNTEKSFLKNKSLSRENMLALKQAGFSDKKIGGLCGKTEMQIRILRKKQKIMPCIFAIDTLAGEVPAKTNYLYLTYHGAHNDVDPLGGNAIAVLGSGPYHIGSSVEFDWSSVHAAMALKKHKKQSIIINCNPETVSTDYDMSDRLYFENLSFETVADIFEFEKAGGLIISVGGQRPNNLAKQLSEANFNILGTNARDIDRAEDRNAFSAMLDKLNILQPKWQSFISMKDAEKFTDTEGFPVLVRPSYVLSGAAMRVCYNKKQLLNFINKAAVLSPEYPVTISKYVENAKELEFDGVAQKGEVMIYGISEHVENAGVHSGDATIVYPTQRVYASTEFQLREISKKIAKELSITGPFNIQFLVKYNIPYVIEVNLRASRTFPMLSKAMDANFPEIAVDSFMGKAKNHNFIYPKSVVVKSPQFSFGRLLGADPVLRVEMASTGEAACFGKDYDDALLKSILSTNRFDFKNKNVLLSLGGEVNKAKFLDTANILIELGYTIFATDTTAQFLDKQNIKCSAVRKAYQQSPNVLDIIENKKVAFVVNLSKAEISEAKGEVGHVITDGFRIRRATVDNQIPLFTDLHLARAFIKALYHYPIDKLEIRSYKEYL